MPSSCAVKSPSINWTLAKSSGLLSLMRSKAYSTKKKSNSFQLVSSRAIFVIITLELKISFSLSGVDWFFFGLTNRYIFSISKQDRSNFSTKIWNTFRSQFNYININMQNVYVIAHTLPKNPVAPVIKTLFPL